MSHIRLSQQAHRVGLTLVLACAVAPSVMAQSPGLAIRAIDRAFVAGRGDSVRRALRPDERTGDAQSALGFAALLRLEFSYDSADRVLRPLVVRTDAIGRAARLEYAQSLYSQGKLVIADSLLARLAPEALGAADSLTAAGAYSVLGAVRERRVGPHSADSLAHIARTVAPDAWASSVPRCQIAYLAARTGNPLASVLARRSADSASAAGNVRAHALCTMALAVDFERLGNPDSTLAALGRVADEHRAQRNWAGLAAVQQWAGYVEQSRGELGAARQRLREAIELATRYRQPSVLAWAHLNLGEVALRLADPLTAITEAEAARTIDEQLGDRWGLALAERMHADALSVGGRYADAEVRYQKTLQLLTAAGNDAATLHVVTRLVSLARHRGDLNAADSLLRDAQSRSARLHVNGGLELDSEAAATRLAHGDLAGAARGFSALLEQHELPNYRFDIQMHLAQVLALQGHADSAGALLADADRRLAVWRRTLTDRDLRTAWLQVRRLDWDADAGAATVIAALAKSGRIDAAFTLAEQRRARVLFDELTRRVSLASGQPPAEPLPTSADSVRAALPDSTAMLFYVAGQRDEPTTAFMLTRQGITAEVLGSIDSMRPKIDRLAGLAASGSLPTALATQLAQALLPATVRALPAAVTHLVIVPDGPLHRLPIELLPIDDVRRLLDHAAVSLVPSAAIAVLGWRHPASHASRIVAFGDPARPRDTTLARLPGARAEARAVARYATNAVVLLGSSATAAALIHADLRHVGVLHFATHALVEEHSPVRSGLVLAPSGIDDGFVGVEQLGALQTDATLVVLSACQTADGTVLAGEGVQGVVAPLLESGAHAVIATRWNLPDAPSRRVIARIYDGLADGLTADAALRRAKLASDAAGEPEAVWGAFVIIGDGSVRVPLRHPPPSAAWWLVPISASLLAIYGAVRWKRRTGDIALVPSERRAITRHDAAACDDGTASSARTVSAVATDMSESPATPSSSTM